MKININDLPIIKETSLHKIVKRVKKNDNKLLTDPITGKHLKTSDYLGLLIDKHGNITKFYAKRPFYWECWDFEKDSNLKEKGHQIKSVVYKYDVCFRIIPEDWNNGVEIGNIINPEKRHVIFLSDDYHIGSGISRRVNLFYSRCGNNVEIIFFPTSGINIISSFEKRHKKLDLIKSN